MPPNTKHKTKFNKKILVFLTLLIGTLLIVTAIALPYFNPVLKYAQFNLRVENGTIMHKLILRPFKGMKMHIRVFNVTNVQQFLDGTDDKVKLEEVGPFVYQEIRSNEDVVINREPGIMWLTPKMRAVFVPEESVGDPENIYLTVPNVPLLSSAAFMSKYPYLMRQIYNYYVSSTNSKAFKTVRAHDIFWGYEDPLITMANNLIPGIVYFKSFGILERLYDHEFDYRLKMGTKTSDKFAVKESIRMKANDISNSENYTERVLTFPENTFEGAVFPSNLSPEQSIYLYRPATCLNLRFQYESSRSMFYGGDGYVYKLHNSSLNDFQLCNSKGWCPRGVMNLGPCYLNMPIIMSKGHFLDADPRLLDHLEGLKPDRKLHDSELVIDPNVGVTVAAKVSAQLSLFLPDVAYNPETKRLQDTVLPFVHYFIEPPKLIPEALDALKFVYTDGPRMLLAGQICCGLVGLGLLLYAANLLCSSRLSKYRKKNLINDHTKHPNQPLMFTKRNKYIIDS